MRTSFSQLGGGWSTALTVNVEAPGSSLVARNSIPPPGRTSTMAFGAFAFSDSRIITPALAKVFVFVMLVTRATICPSPFSG